jgi:hypothetical protein
MGGKLDGLKFPHIELIVQEKKTGQSDKIEGNISYLFDSSSSLVKEIYSIYLSSINMTYKNTSLKSKIMAQREDGYGKIRNLAVDFNSELVGVMTSPISNFYKDQFIRVLDSSKYRDIFEKNKIDIDTAIEFFNYEGIREIQKIMTNETILGVFGVKDNVNYYVPVQYVKNVDKYNIIKLFYFKSSK